MVTQYIIVILTQYYNVLVIVLLDGFVSTVLVDGFVRTVLMMYEFVSTVLMITHPSSKQY
jgi:hypothetical protein